MPDTRFTPRRRQRARVSLDETQHLFADVDAQGFAVTLPRVFPVGTAVRGEVALGERTFPFQGEVSWSHLGDPRLSFVGRMGIRFTRVPDAFFAALRASVG